MEEDMEMVWHDDESLDRPETLARSGETLDCAGEGVGEIVGEQVADAPKRIFARGGVAGDSGERRRAFDSLKRDHVEQGARIVEI